MTMSRLATILILVTLTGCVITSVADNDPALGAALRPKPLPKPSEPVSAQDVIDDRERGLILAEVTAYYRDLTARDWDAFARHFWRGAVVTMIWEPQDGSERRVDFISVPDFIAQMDLGQDSTFIFEQKMGTVELQFDGTVAQVWSRHRVRFGEPGAVRDWIDVDAFTLMKHVGLWKISSMALSGN